MTDSVSGSELLSVRNITVRFGGIVALDGVSFDVKQGQILGLIGPNGAGKTTLFNCLSCVYRLESGEISFAGQVISRLPAHRVAPLGIGRTFQNLAMFHTMSVRQNIMVGGHSWTRAGFLATALNTPSAKREEALLGQVADDLISEFELGPYEGQSLGSLPFAIQKRVEFARALASKPKLLLLDEPAAGLNHLELTELKRLIRDVRDRMNITVLLVEHHMSLVMALCDHIVVLNFGRKIGEGAPASIQANPDVIAAYLGAGSNA